MFSSNAASLELEIWSKRFISLSSFLGEVRTEFIEVVGTNNFLVPLFVSNVAFSGTSPSGVNTDAALDQNDFREEKNFHL